MIEALIAAQTGIALFTLSILFFIAVKLEGMNGMSHRILEILKEISDSNRRFEEDSKYEKEK